MIDEPVANASENSTKPNSAVAQSVRSAPSSERCMPASAPAARHLRMSSRARTATRLELAGCLADQLLEPALHVHVDVFELRAERERAGGELPLYRLESPHDRVALGRGEEPRSAERLRPRDAARDVVAPEALVKGERRGEALGARIGGLREAPRPRLVLPAGLGGAPRLHVRSAAMSSMTRWATLCRAVRRPRAPSGERAARSAPGSGRSRLMGKRMGSVTTAPRTTPSRSLWWLAAPVWSASWRGFYSTFTDCGRAGSGRRRLCAARPSSRSSGGDRSSRRSRGTSPARDRAQPRSPRGPGSRSAPAGAPRGGRC